MTLCDEKIVFVRCLCECVLVINKALDPRSVSTSFRSPHFVLGFRIKDSKRCFHGDLKRGNAFILVQSGGYEASISGTHVSVMSLTVNPKETLVSRRAAA